MKKMPPFSSLRPFIVSRRQKSLILFLHHHHITPESKREELQSATMAFGCGKAYASLVVVLLCRDSSAWTQLPTNTGARRTALTMSSGGSRADGKSKGTVKWFDAGKGFGFITPDDGSADIFVHQTSIQTEGFRSLADGEKVEYVVETDDDDSSKLRAAQVTGPDGGDVQGETFPQWKRSMK